MRRSRRGVAACVLVACVLAPAAGRAERKPMSTPSAATPAPAAGYVRVDIGARRQTIEGFGVSTRVWSDPHLSDAPSTSFPVDARDAILALLIDDLGITRVRPIIEAGIEPDNDNGDPAVLAPQRFVFAGKLTDEHIDLVEQVRQRGVPVWFPTMLQPEPWMSEHEPDEYVERLLAQLLRWEARGVVPPYISPVNEPTLPIAGAFSTEWLVEVVRILGRRIDEAGLPTRIVIPDDVEPTSALAKASAVLGDPDARHYVAAIGYHLYGGDPADRRRITDLAASYSVPVWMTEYSQEDWESWPAVLGWASIVHELLAVDDVAAVDYMWGFFGSQERGHTLIAVEFDGGAYRAHRPTAAYWVTGQWSRFVPPGSARVAVTGESTASLISAFVDPGETQLTVVAVNVGPVAEQVAIEIGRPLAGEVRVVRSTASEQWAEGAPVASAATSFVADVAPESVTTFVVPFSG